MRMIGARTVRRSLWATREWLYDFLNFQSVVEARRKSALEAVMGFSGQWDEHRRFQMDLLLRLGLQPGHRLLEIGCGPLTAGVPVVRFLDEDGYTGVDVRGSATDVAWREIGENKLSGKNPHIIRADDFGRAYFREGEFDFIWAFSVLFHLEDRLIDELIQMAAHVLKSNGVLVGNINASAHESRWLEFPFVRREPAFYAEAAARHGLSMEILGTLHELGFRQESLEKENIVISLRRA